MTTPPPPQGNPPQPYGAPPGFGPPPPPSAFAPQPPQEAPEGPEFMAVDRHNSVVVDSAGVAFEDHGHSAEFPWHEIHSVHYKAGPGGKTLMMAVIHLDGRFYECVVDARSRDTLGQWFAQLAPVLGYYRPLA
ncbi:hypothetical protein [Streptomyces sp. Root369]|uniref:hypothetical protein n=1 Tax=Streptomyces sp. Root369 TaxID=1736523 RepID=UPI00070ABC92|nr:hypothetical protein [Streptomyces sp. Root369]KQW14457.1 hypothetical protein ASD08_28850 [Streptomyces sp. Root369]